MDQSVEISESSLTQAIFLSTLLDHMAKAIEGVIERVGLAGYFLNNACATRGGRLEQFSSSHRFQHLKGDGIVQRFVSQVATVFFDHTVCR